MISKSSTQQAWLRVRASVRIRFLAFCNPISALFYFVPISLLPEPVAFRVTIFISTLIYCLALYQFSRRHLVSTLLALLSPLLLYNVFYTSVEWLCVLGALVNPLPGFLLAWVKPQVGVILAVMLLLLISRRYGWKLAAVMCLVQALIFGLSFAWGLSWAIAVPIWGNYSLFPYGLLVGIPLAVYALRRADRASALACGPFLSPYIAIQSWVAILPLAVRRRWASATLMIASWLLVLIYFWSGQ
jgi:hypothetical protein